MLNLEVHHKELRSRSGDDAEPNLITLCTACHANVHGSGARAGGEPAAGMALVTALARVLP